MSGPPDSPGPPGGSAEGLGDAERARLRPLADALRRAAARRTASPSLTLVQGDLVGADRVGLLAGTFNPLTTAHAALAESGRQAGCDRVLLTMAPVSLAKETVERAHALDRLDWLVTWARAHPWTAVAVASHPLLVDMVEACARLLAEIHAQPERDGAAPGDVHEAQEAPRPVSPAPAGPSPGRSPGGVRAGPAIVLLLGADKAAQIAEPGWYDDPDAAHARLARLASVMVAVRAGHPLELPELPFPATPLPTPAWAVDRSSTEARAAAAGGRGLAGLVPGEVAAAVLRSGAYDSEAGPYLLRLKALHELVGAA